MLLPRCVRLLVVVVLGTVVSRAAPVEFPGEKEEWLHLRSPHFELYTSGSESLGREALHRLEIIRAVFLDAFKLRERLPIPVTVFRFHTDRLFKAYTPENLGSNVAGFYLRRPDRATIVLGQTSQLDDARQLVHHEYIHHLFRVLEEEPPTWYNEGIADLFSTLQYRKGEVIFGHPLEWHVVRLRQERLFPLEELFRVDRNSPLYRSHEQTGLFYAQSWALMHYWFFGKNGLDFDRLNLFLRLAREPAVSSSPETLRTLCQELLGLTYEQLTDRLERYIRSGTFLGRKVALPPLENPKSYASRRVPRPEVHARLAELDLRTKQSPLGKLALLELSETEPADPRVLETLGVAALYEQDPLTARSWWDRAMAAGSDNPAIPHELAQMEGAEWFRRFDLHFRMRPEQADRLRDLLGRSLAAAPDQSAGYEMLAWVEGTAQQPNLANGNLVQRKFATLSNKPRTLLALALLRVHVDDRATALNLLEELDKMQPDPWVANAAETLRASLEGRSPRRLHAVPAGPAPIFSMPRVDLPR